MSKIIRVFPRKTSLTPTDQNVRINALPNAFDKCDEVRISVSFTWDLPRAEELYKEWSKVANTTVGGPALGDKGEDFIPGMYLKEGVTITSRGCSNKCWFCSVWKRDGSTRELAITPGHIVQDDNLLSCSESHVKRVFEMLRAQREPITFSGGIEAKLLQDWHVDLFKSIKLKELFCAYDTPDDYEPLIYAGRKLNAAGITLRNRKARCYVLIGFPGDTFEKAEKRLVDTVNAGFFPFAMLYRDQKGDFDKEWRRLQREWANPIILGSKVKDIVCQLSK